MSVIIADLIEKLEAMGYSLCLEGEKVRFSYTGAGEPPAEAKTLIDNLRGRKAEAMGYLKAQERKPYFDLDGALVIPFASDPRFHYWNGGQSIEKTEEDVRSWKH